MSIRIFVGDCRDVLKGMAAGSVHCVVTSPPYFGQRDYNIAPVIWGGDDADCAHVWGKASTLQRRGAQGDKSTLDGRVPINGEDRIENIATGQFCRKCDAWLGCLGNEPTPTLYVQHLVEVFSEVKRVLRDDGVLFLNLGDSFFGDSPARRKSSEAFSETWDKAQTRSRGGSRRSAASVDNLKPKDLIGIPWRVALALQADGWWLRAAMPWIKASAMPESVTDRVTRAHEHVFMLTKSRRYFYDQEAVRVPNLLTSGWAKQRIAGNPQEKKYTNDNADPKGGGYRGDGGFMTYRDNLVTGRNRRTSDTFNESLDIRIEDQRAYLAHLEHIRDNGGMLLSEDGDPVALLVNTANFSGKHFAVFPTKLVEPLIACGSSERGCCPKCLSPWERVVEKTVAVSKKCPKTDALYNAQGGNGEKRTGTIGMSGGGRINGTSTTLGWQPTCECSGLTIIGDQPLKPSEPKKKKGESHFSFGSRLLDYDAKLALWQTRMDSWRRHWADLKPLYDAEPIVPCVILDPFAGAGTALLQADRMGRDAIGIDISGDYAEMARERVKGDAPMFVDVKVVHS